MLDILALMTLKSKDLATRSATLDAFTDALGPRLATHFRDLIDADGVVSVEGDADERIIRYALLAIYAADIASVPDRRSRDFHLASLRDVVAQYGISYDRVIYLTRLESQFVREIEHELSTTAGR